MKFNIYITIDNNLGNKNNKYHFDNRNNFCLYINSKDKMDNLLNNVDSIRKCIKDDIEEEKNYGSEETEYFKLLNDLFNKKDSFYKNVYNDCETIYINGNFKDVCNFIANNPELTNKKIILENEFDLNTEDYLYIKENLSKYSNIFYSIVGNDSKVNYAELEKTFNIIDSLVEQIKRMDFSPIEQVMYLYDIVRDKVYTRESENEKYQTSRDLTSVLLGKKIVCLGYSNIMSSVLNKLNFKNEVYILASHKGDKGHARNLVYIKDDKYNIDGYYFFDATWDSKRQDGNINYLYSYRYFANSLDQMNDYDGNRFYSSEYPCFNESKFFEAMDLIEDGRLSNVDYDIVRTINKLSMFIRGERIISVHYRLPENIQKSIGVERKYSDEELIEELSLYLDMFNRNLDANTLIRVLYEVRKKEYYSEPNKYPFDIDSLYAAVINSNWLFNHPESKLLESIFGVSVSNHMIGNTTKEFDEFAELNDLKRKIEQIKVTKLLRSHLEIEKNKGL